jgi:glutaredoxin/uncharacterized membrane protein YphA (DoxX/SURF4 family)
MKKAKIVRMVTPQHTCPWGLKALDILKRSNFEIEDVHLESQEANQAYKEEHDVSETPQIFIEGERIGGYDALREHVGMPPEDPEGTTYQPIIAIFSVTALMAVTTSLAMAGEFAPIRMLELFITFSMCVLGIMKLRDLHSFATEFLGYDLLARKVVRYAYVYPFVEASAGVLMIGGFLTWLVAPAALFVSTIGAVSVFKAVYIDKRKLECACVGGNSSVPLGFVSLTENLMMMAMSIWMLYQ